MRILVIDGQGGGIGRSLVELLVKNFPDAEVGATQRPARGNQPGYCHGSFFQQGKGGADSHESLPGLYRWCRREESCRISPGRHGHYTEDCGKIIKPSGEVFA